MCLLRYAEERNRMPHCEQFTLFGTFNCTLGSVFLTFDFIFVSAFFCTFVSTFGSMVFNWRKHLFLDDCLATSENGTCVFSTSSYCVSE